MTQFVFKPMIFLPKGDKFDFLADPSQQCLFIINQT